MYSSDIKSALECPFYKVSGFKEKDQVNNSTNCLQMWQKL